MKQYRVPLFYPYVTKEMRQAAYDALGDKIITQGPKVEEFEKLLIKSLDTKYLLTLNSGTSALELAFHLLDLKPGDEVISPVFTFIGANMPLVRRGVKVIFSDIKDNLLIDWDDAMAKITPRTKAIVNAHLFGLESVPPRLSTPIVGDAAQFLAKTSKETFTAYSFQSVKLMTTVDGGALACKSKVDYKRAKLLRWYGIDRETGKDNTEVDIKEPGYKYHMNDVTAAIGIAAIKEIKRLKKERALLEAHYRKLIGGVGGSPYLIHVNNRDKLRAKLDSMGVQTSLGHRRNDIYSVFGAKRQNLPNMNSLEKTYLLLPCHNHMSTKDVEFICQAIKSYNLKI
jgi:dTDP-4-amino-4,6-dideoxygalactose transaminase